MRIYLIAIFLFSVKCQCVLAQNRRLTDSEFNKSTATKIRFAEPPNCDEIDDWLKSDITKKTIFLFLQSGLAPVTYKTDEEFESKYGVYFDDFGDVGMLDYKCVIKYNYMVFDYLASKYGKKWWKEIRKDVIGFKEWKKKK